MSKFSKEVFTISSGIYFWASSGKMFLLGNKKLAGIEYTPMVTPCKGHMLCVYLQFV